MNKPHRSIYRFILLIHCFFAFSSLSSSATPGLPAGFLPPDRAWVKRQLQRLSLQDKVAQLVQIRVYGRYYHDKNPEYLDLIRLVGKQHVGGVILFAGNIYESALLLNRLQKAAPLPLMVASDFENGAAFRITDATSFPWMMAVGATGSEDLAHSIGKITAQEARALGVHWVYAPVMDVNSNPDNPVINTRSFGEQPELVARLGSAFIRGCRENGVLTTAKHFPGHGDTAVDSHIGLPVLTADMERLDSLELVPFKAAIEAGVDSIMTGHLAVPALTNDATLPATFSPQILKGLLGEKMQFKGLIVTDALEMGGITKKFGTEDAAVMAIKAGADLLLLPPDPESAIRAVVQAVMRGEIPKAQIDQSVKKFLLAKTRLGLHRRRIVPIEKISAVVASPEDLHLSRNIAEKSITLVRDDKLLIPLATAGSSRMAVLIVTDGTESNPLPSFQLELRRRFSGLRISVADSRMNPDQANSILDNLQQADRVLLVTLVRTASYKGTVGLPTPLHELMEKAIGLGKSSVWVSFGNPYLLSLFPEISTYLCTYGSSENSQVAAVKALTGEAAISGRLPISIPGCATVGTGIERPLAPQP